MPLCAESAGVGSAAEGRALTSEVMTTVDFDETGGGRRGAGPGDGDDIEALRLRADGR